MLNGPNRVTGEDEENAEDLRRDRVERPAAGKKKTAGAQASALRPDPDRHSMKRLWNNKGGGADGSNPRSYAVSRYTPWARVNHWITAGSLILLALSGLSLFHPSLFFLSDLFGGGENVRAIHPWFGVVLALSFLGLFIRFFRLNLWERNDNIWLGRLRSVLAGREENLPEVGKYNAGQKLVFWLQSILIVIMVVSGLGLWEIYFATTSPSSRSVVGPDSLHCRRQLHTGLDRPRLCGDLGQGHGARHDARRCFRRLCLAPPSQMAARRGRQGPRFEAGCRIAAERNRNPMSGLRKPLSPEAIASGEVAKPPFAVLADPRRGSSVNARRFAVLAPGHQLEAYCGFSSP